MKMIDPYIAELEHESAVTRKYLERLPEIDYDWRPHPKSMPIGYLASHIAELPGWTDETLNQEEMVLDLENYKPWIGTNRAEILDAFDRSVTKAMEAMRHCTDEQFLGRWRLKVDGQVVLDMPRPAVLRGFVFSHLVHHRAQLGLYLRLNDVPVPATYGPSADEQDPSMAE